MQYLEFEKPIEKLVDKLITIEKLKSEGVDTKKTIADLKLKIKNKRNEIYSSLTPGKKFNFQDIHKDHIHSIIFHKLQTEILLNFMVTDHLKTIKQL